MKADIYLIDPDTQKEYFVGNHEVRTPEERAKKKKEFMDFLKSIGADIEYMKQHGHLD